MIIEKIMLEKDLYNTNKYCIIDNILEINYAKKVIDAFDKADGGLVVVDGKLIEKPVLRSVKRVLANVDETLS